MKGKIILVLALPLLAYAGVKVYLHLQVAESFDTLTEQMAPFAAVSYESITSSFDGTFGIVGLVIRPHAVADKITISEITAKYPSMFYVLDMEERFAAGELPAELSMDLELFDGLPVELNEDMVAAYTEFVEGGSQLVVSADPREPRALKFLDLYAPEDIPALLNITIQVIN